jgi:hypothetical protein
MIIAIRSLIPSKVISEDHRSLWKPDWKDKVQCSLLMDPTQQGDAEVLLAVFVVTLRGHPNDHWIFSLSRGSAHV